jgi:alginate O-acetyltransferase complex protein AlgJ
MNVNLQTFEKKMYPVLFAVLFWIISIVPTLNPNLTLDNIGASFLGHSQLIRIFNTIRLKIGDRVFPLAVVGKDGWLFYTSDYSMADYQRLYPFTNRELAFYQKSFDDLYHELKQKGITLIVVIAPNKEDIYPQYMPDEIKAVGKSTRLDQFISYMHEHGKTPIIDLRPDLVEASKTEQVYYKTDTHWNLNAGYIAYAKIMSVLSQYYPNMEPHPLSDYRIVPGGLDTMGLSQSMGVNLEERSLDLQPKFTTETYAKQITLYDSYNVSKIWRLTANQNQNLPKALIYHDSFFLAVLPFLEPHFSRTISIPHEGTSVMWNIDWIYQIHPDVVIIEYVEFYMNDNFDPPVHQ